MLEILHFVVDAIGTVVLVAGIALGIAIATGAIEIEMRDPTEMD